ncbi:stage II sporulation protein GA (sporulation sigma-E factor processing peptidase) [Desulfitispora alkaliphila]|uniref:sigma-E processing peptidase SpoIIGA n=1 Tax=Desulfitispora alkaliphila TaxID=622674 RepID=UPI003D2289A2
MDSYQIVYVDTFFSVNVFMNIFILWMAARIGQFTVNSTRLVLAALVGAIFSLALLLPQGSYYNYSVWFGLVKFTASVVMFLLSFGFVSIRRLIYGMGYFYLVAFSTGGAIYGLISFFGVDSLNEVIKFIWLPLGMLIIAITFSKIIHRVKQKALTSQNRFTVTISIDGMETEVAGLVDTGNSLKDPITNLPVVIVEASKLRNIMPSSLLENLESEDQYEVMGVLQSKGHSNWQHKLKLIPFSSIGNSGGMLLGFKPDWIIIRDEKNYKRTKDVVVCVFKRRLCSEGSYNALLHPEIAQQLT